MRLASLCLTCLVAVSLERSPLAQTRRALLIGINLYEPPFGESAANIQPNPVSHPLLPKRAFRTSSSFSNLGGAVADARDLRQTLLARFGFDPARIRMLEDRQATRAAILAAIREQLMPTDARPGDVSLFFYAGHGSQVFDSLSPAEDGYLDESLVPADAYRGVPDIRDKELNRLFNDILDRGLTLTVIVDSCHSGSIARGPRSAPSRALDIDPRDAHDPGDTKRLSAQERGALILSSAQRNQEALETPDRRHGAFSWALNRVLDSESPELPMSLLFQQVRGLMQSQASSQEPVMAGADKATGVDRARLTLLGGKAAGANSDAMFFRGPLQGNRVWLEGALAASLSPDCELQRGNLRLRVTKVLNLTQVEAETIQGGAAAAHAGDVFELSRWVAPPTEILRVLAPADVPDAFLKQLPFGANTTNETVRIVRSLNENPQYAIERRAGGGGVEYALAALNAADPESSVLPAHTDWVPAAKAAVALGDYAARIQRIRGFLQLASPPGPRFPYRLALRNVKTGRVVSEGVLVEGDEYRLMLLPDGLDPSVPVQPRYVYAFTIDRKGNGTLLYPGPSTGTDGNRLPADDEPSPGPIPLGRADETFQIAPPLGVDTYFLLTTIKPLPHPGVLDFDGVATEQTRGQLDPLESLLRTTGGPVSRGPALAPAKWSVQKTSFRSVPKPK